MNKTGLSSNEVLQKRRLFGNNEISAKNKNSFFKLLLESLGDPIIRILLIALAIKLLFLFKNYDWYETVGIFIAVFLASFISSISEYGSESAFNALQNESEKINARVLRDNKVKLIPVSEIVVDDVVLLMSGEKIPADGFIIEGKLTVDESMFTGETKEIYKECTNNFDNPRKHNFVYRGSVIYNGDAKMIVKKVGFNTEYGILAKEIQEKNPPSPLKMRLTGLAKIISRIGYVGAIIVTLSYLFSVIIIDNKFEWSSIVATLTNFPIMMDYLIYALTLSVTIIVVAVPEGLPMMITLVLSSNMKRMLKSNVLVRKLVGIETSGSLNVLLTDKTGTLTKGNLSVKEFISGDLCSYSSLNKVKTKTLTYKTVYESLYYNNASILTDKEIIGGNITDKALLKFIEKKENFDAKIINKIPFNSKDKYSVATIDNGNTVTYVKGAPEIILNMCTKYLNANNESKLIFDKSKIEESIIAQTKSSCRVIALAYNDKSEKLEYMTLIGFITLKDELRPESKLAVKTITEAGIQTIMITGDEKNTAESIAREVGLINSSEDIVLTSSELAKYNDIQISQVLPHIKVIARALPQDKSRLVKIIMDKGQVVGMTGDGVNDAPALKKANVGFAMGSGTEVAKEASDIVILDDNIMSISKAILYGRTIFKSIRKFIIYQCTVNMCALILSIIGPFIGINTPITIIQMLWLNMIMDTFAGLAFSFEPPLDSYMKEKPKRKDEPIMNKYMFNSIFFTGLYSATLCILFLKLPIVKVIFRVGDNNMYLMTAYFALFIFIGIFNSFNARSERLNIFANLRKNKVFLGVFLFIIIAQLYLIYFGGNVFRTYGLTAKELFIVILLAMSVIPIDFIRKTFIKKHRDYYGV